MKEKAALVCGATGFIGSHLTHRLSNEGVDVKALFRSDEKKASFSNPQVEWIKCDLTDVESIRGITDGIDVVYNAVHANIGVFDTAKRAEQILHEVDIQGSLNLAREVLRNPDTCLIHLSSTAAMGIPKTSIVDETSSCHPITPYQKAKRQTELELLKLHREQGLKVIILRPCLVLGEGKIHKELLNMFRWAQKGIFPYIGSNHDIRKPLVMVDDLVEAMLLSAEKGRHGEIYLIHSGINYTLGEMLEVIGRLTGKSRTHFHVPEFIARLAIDSFSLIQHISPNFKPPITKERLDLLLSDRQIDIKKAHGELGYIAKHQDLYQILSTVYNWYSKMGLL